MVGAKDEHESVHVLVTLQLKHMKVENGVIPSANWEAWIIMQIKNKSLKSNVVYKYHLKVLKLRYF